MCLNVNIGKFDSLPTILFFGTACDDMLGRTEAELFTVSLTIISDGEHGATQSGKTGVSLKEGWTTMIKG
jgi:hypothetical protein